MRKDILTVNNPWEAPQRYVAEPLPQGLEVGEIESVGVQILTLSGPAGTGKTTVGHSLEQLLRIPYLKIGAILRELAKARRGPEAEIVGFEERSPDDDLVLDTKIAEAIAGGTTQPHIIEGHLAGWIATVEQAKADAAQPFPTIFRVLLTTESEDVRLERVFNRQVKKDQLLLREDSDAATRDRERKDAEQWRQLYPALQRIEFEDIRNDHDIYDLVVATDTMDVDQVTQVILHELKVRGLLTEKQPLPSEGDIFVAGEPQA